MCRQGATILRSARAHAQRMGPTACSVRLAWLTPGSVACSMLCVTPTPPWLIHPTSACSICSLAHSLLHMAAFMSPWLTWGRTALYYHAQRLLLACTTPWQALALHTSPCHELSMTWCRHVVCGGGAPAVSRSWRRQAGCMHEPLVL